MMGEQAYTRAAIERAAGAVLAAPEGGRNEELNRQAHGLFGLALAGRIEADEARDSLSRAAEAVGLQPAEIRATLASAWRAAEPRNAEPNGKHRSKAGSPSKAEPPRV